MWLPDRRKHAEHSRVRALLAALPDESLILSVAARIYPGEIADAMMTGVDLARHPGWVEVTAATLDRLETVELYQRRHYLVAQLPDPQRRNRLSPWWRGVSGPSSRVRAGRPTAPAARDRGRSPSQAEELRAQLRTVGWRSPSPGEIRWLYARAVRRGLVDELPLAGWPDRLRAMCPAATTSRSPHRDSPRWWKRTSATAARRTTRIGPWHRRYLRVETPSGVSYQTFAVVADAPQQFAFPGGCRSG